MQPRAPTYAEATAGKPAADHCGEVRPKAFPSRSAGWPTEFTENADEDVAAASPNFPAFCSSPRFVMPSCLAPRFQPRISLITRMSRTNHESTRGEKNERAPESLCGRATTDAHRSTRMRCFRCSRGRSPRIIPGDVPPKALPSRSAGWPTEFTENADEDVAAASPNFPAFCSSPRFLELEERG